MTTKITLHEDDLRNILVFASKFPQDNTRIGAGFVEIEVDNSSGIGQIVTASIYTTVREMDVKVTRSIVDEGSW